MQLYVAVIRCSLLDGYDPIAEIDKLIATHKSAWFGKYGQPLGKDVKKNLESKERPVYVLLVRKGSEEEGGKYIYKAYRLISVMRDEVPKNAIYPMYYSSFLNRISSWVWLTTYDAPDFNLDDVITRTSALPVRKSLLTSMRGHFNCVLRVRQDK